MTVARLDKTRPKRNVATTFTTTLRQLPLEEIRKQGSYSARWLYQYAIVSASISTELGQVRILPGRRKGEAEIGRIEIGRIGRCWAPAHEKEKCHLLNNSTRVCGVAELGFTSAATRIHFAESADATDVIRSICHAMKHDCVADAVDQGFPKVQLPLSPQHKETPKSMLFTFPEVNG